MKDSSSVRVTHVTSAHLPNDTRIFLKECTTLASAGYDVNLVAAARENIQSTTIPVVTIPAPRSRSGRLLLTAVRATIAARRLKSDVYHLHDPELLPFARLLKSRRSIVIYDAHEDLAKQVRGKEWIPKVLRGPASRLLQLVLPFLTRRLDAVVAATSPIARSFPHPRTAIVRNFPLQTELLASVDIRLRDRPPTIAYVGVVTSGRGVAQCLKALTLLPSHHGARMIVAGNFAPAAFERDLRVAPGANLADFVGWQSRDAVRQLLAQSRIGVVLLQEQPNHVEAMPTKLFEYMSAGLPVIASDFPAWRDIVGTTGCGLLVNPSDPVAIADAIVWLLTHPNDAEVMGLRGRAAIRDEFSWERESLRLLALYSEAVR